MAVHMRLDIVRALKRLRFWSALATMVAESTIVYRLWAQLAGSEPSLPALALVYGLAGRLVDPFRGLDTVRARPTGPVLEFPALVALEVYLVAGVLVVILLSGLAAALAWARVPVIDVEFHPEEHRRALAGQARRALARGDVLAYELREALRRVGYASRPLVTLWLQDMRAGLALTARVAAEAAVATRDLGKGFLIRARAASAHGMDRLRVDGAAMAILVTAGAVHAYEHYREAGSAFGARLAARWHECAAAALRYWRESAAWLRWNTAAAFDLAGRRVEACVVAFQAFENGGPAGRAAPGQRLTRRQFLHRVRVDG
jgi:hypothetical protein